MKTKTKTKSVTFKLTSTEVYKLEQLISKEHARAWNEWRKSDDAALRDSREHKKLKASMHAWTRILDSVWRGMRQAGVKHKQSQALIDAVQSLNSANKQLFAADRNATHDAHLS